MTARRPHPQEPLSDPIVAPHLIKRRRLAARRARTARIRRRIAGTTVTAFIALFATIYVQMAAGHDPALSKTTKRSSSATASASQTTTSQAAPSQTTTSPTTTSPAAPSPAPSAPSRQAGSQSVAPVTSSQS